MAALLSLQNYTDSNESGSDTDAEKDGFNAHLKPLDKPLVPFSSSMALVAAPDVVSNVMEKGGNQSSLMNTSPTFNFYQLSKLDLDQIYFPGLA